MASNSLIPEGCTYLNSSTFITTKAKDIVEGRLLQKASNRDPDAFDMYIYNDFFSYALLDLVDKTLSTLHAKIVKKDWSEAFFLLEALSAFHDIESSWPMCDDGERVELTDKVYGASLVTTLRALDKEGRLDATSFPTLETLLISAAEWGSAMEGSTYHLVCKAIGRRLFKDKSPEVVAMEKARLEEWIAGLGKADQAHVRAAIKENEEEAVEAAAEGHVEKAWYAGGKASDEHDKDPDYTLSRVWREYRGYLSTVPTKPLRGPANWDISKWSEAQRQPFKFGNGSDDDAMDF